MAAKRKKKTTTRAATKAKAKPKTTVRASKGKATSKRAAAPKKKPARRAARPKAPAKAKAKAPAKAPAKSKANAKAKAPTKAPAKTKAAPETKARPKAASAPSRPAAPTRYTFETIEQVEHFSAPPEVIYRAWIDAAQHAAFTGSPATSDAQPGGGFTAWDGYIQGKHVDLVENEKIVQTWRASDFPSAYPDSRLELTLTPESGGTLLRLRHASVPKKNAQSYAEGWHEHYWRPLRAYLAQRS